MDSYGKFAYLYDDLMKDVPYHQWIEFVMKYTDKYNIQGKRLLDLACGTGELSVRFSEKGYEVTGVDLSADMLAVARLKADHAGANIKFYQQNMSELEGFDKFDLICIFCDSLNYLETETDVQNTFHRVNNYLAKDGLFFFDVHSIHKIAHIFMNQTFAVNEDRISYIWQCYEGEHPYSVEHDLSFFVLDEKSGQYDKYDEWHFQRTYPLDIYEEWLRKAGFEILEVAADFEAVLPQTKSERIFFICKKSH